MSQAAAKLHDKPNEHPLKIKGLETKRALESMLAGEIRRLSKDADVCVYALYDAECPHEGPIEYHTAERDPERGMQKLNVGFDFEGVGVWYICRRFGDAYRLQHILVHIHRGRIIKGQMEQFEGFWDEFPQFVAEDRWIKSLSPMPPKLPKIVEDALPA